MTEWPSVPLLAAFLIGFATGFGTYWIAVRFRQERPARH